MNNEGTTEKMNLMKLVGMVRAFKLLLETGTNGLTADEIVAHLIDAEWDERYNRRLAGLLQAAKLRYRASLEQMDFTSQRNLNKNDFLRLAECDWLRKGQSVIITGSTGAGKSFAACALATQACKEGFKTVYYNCLKLFSQLQLAKADGSYFRVINKIQKQDLIILDDFGLKPLDSQSRLIFLEILEDRHSLKSTLITSQLPIAKWHEIIGDPTIADAICDRLIHNSLRIELEAKDSMRKMNNN